MHDLWEGIVHDELVLLLIRFKFISLEILNHLISLFNYESLQLKNRPIIIRNIGKAVNIRETSAKMMSLFNFLPFLIADKIPINNKHWDLSLSHIIKILYTLNINHSLLSRLEWLIDEHHSLYKKLFPNETLKYHNLVHYSTAILKLGNLLDYSNFRFEADHPLVKTTTNTLNNTKNLLNSTSKKRSNKNICRLNKSRFFKFGNRFKACRKDKY